MITTDAADRSLLIVEDDEAFRARLAQAMAKRGFEVEDEATVAGALARIGDRPPAFAVIDLSLGDGGGLDVALALKAARPDARPLILTGYGDIRTAVAAVRLGAVDCLSKPASADDVTAALLAPPRAQPAPPEAAPSPGEVREAHIRRVFERCGGNVSETARQLNMHRRTLQRILNRDRAA